MHRGGIWLNEGDGWRERYHQGTPDTQGVDGAEALLDGEDVAYAIDDGSGLPAGLSWAQLGLDESGQPGPRCAPGAGAPASAEVRDAIVAQESKLLGPAGRSDAEWLERTIHPDFDEIGRTGYSWTRAEVISKLQTVPDQTKRVEFGRVVELAPGVAHIRFRTHDDRGIVHRSSIWIDEGRGWRQRYHQGTPDTQTG